VGKKRGRARSDGRTGAPAWLAAAALLGLAGCPPTPPPAGQAQVTVVVQAETTPACLAITIASATTERRRIDLQPQQTQVPLTGLPVGEVVLSFYGHDVRCAMVGPASVPVSVGGPITGTLVAGTTNPAITVDLFQAGAETIAFDPDAPPMCTAGGSACTSDEQCCSRRCQRQAPTGAARLCEAQQPPAPAGNRVTPKPERLAELRGRASFPAFDGDAFFVAFPQRPDPQGADGGARTVRAKYLVPVLEAVGLDQQLTERKFPLPPEAPILLPQANFFGLLANACSGESNDLGKLLCDSLASPNGPTEAVARFIEDTVGASPATLREDITRDRTYFLFSQRDRGVAIEHKGVVVLRQGKDMVSTVQGAVVGRYRIVNEVGLNFATAMARAIPILAQVEQVPFQASAREQRRGQLVLLPFGFRRDDRGEQPAALRFAYRTNVVTNSRVPGKGSYALWIDALNGDVLKYVAESAEAALQFSPWCRDPSTGNGLCPVNLEVPEPPPYGLVTPSFNLVRTDAEVALPTHLGIEQLFPNAGNACGTTPDDITYRSASAFAHLDRARRMFEFGGSFVPLGQVKVIIDGSGSENFANFGARTIHLVEGNVTSAGCAVSAFADRFNGAEDSTIVAHEIAHLSTMQLQSSNPANACGPDGCPVSDPYNRTFFHDYSDGYAAMLTDSPCIGGWASKNVTSAGALGTGSADVALACAGASEGSSLPRLLFADPDPENAFEDGAVFLGTPRLIDSFPGHRNLPGGSLSPYADGQIVGAALWHAWQGVRSQMLVAGTLPIWGRLNTAVWGTGFAPTICPALEPGCDVNIYRAGRDILIQYANAWVTGGSSALQSINKLFSAFARVGLFVAPVNCLDGDPTTSDPHLCPGGDTGADAIVDIDDGDHGSSDGLIKTGVRLEDDDYVRGDPSPANARANLAPIFRVWTGTPFSFSPAAADGAPAPTSPSAGMCNTSFQVEYRLSSVGPWEVAASSASPGAAVGAKGVPCYAEVRMDDTPWAVVQARLGGLPRVKVEYRVLTWSGPSPMPGGPTLRNSMSPGSGLWPPPAAGFKPSAFFITTSGSPVIF
jgi:hypothetical protein